MVLDRAPGEDQSISDVSAGASFGEMPEHVELTSRQAGGIAPRRRPRAAWNLGAQPAKPAGDHRRDGRGTQLGEDGE